MRIRGVLFDLDGTLAETNPTHVEAWRRAFAEFGHHIPRDRIARQIGKGGDNLVPALIPEEAADEQGPALRDGHERHFIALAKERRFQLTPGAVELIQAVRARGLTAALATSSNTDHLAATFASLGTDLRERMDEATTADDAEQSKPAPDLVTAAAGKLGLPPTACVLIGDTPYDGEAAMAVGCRFWGVLTGGFTENDLRAAGADDVFRDPADLLARLDDTLDAANEAPPISHRDALLSVTNTDPPADKDGLRGGTQTR